MTNFLLAAQGGGGGGMEFMVFIGLFFVILYFFMIRPQTKKAKEQKNFLGNLQKGTRIVTIGGIHGKIVQVDDDTFLIDVDSNTKLRIEKSTVSLEHTKALLQRMQKGSKDSK